MAVEKDEDLLKNNTPHMIVGTPGRILARVRSRALNAQALQVLRARRVW